MVLDPKGPNGDDALWWKVVDLVVRELGGSEQPLCTQCVLDSLSKATGYFMSGFPDEMREQVFLEFGRDVNESMTAGYKRSPEAKRKMQ